MARRAHGAARDDGSKIVHTPATFLIYSALFVVALQQSPRRARAAPGHGRAPGLSESFRDLVPAHAGNAVRQTLCLIIQLPGRNKAQVTGSRSARGRWSVLVRRLKRRRSSGTGRDSLDARYRSSTSRAPRHPEQQIIIEPFPARSASVSTSSRWSGVPSSTATSQSPQMPSRQV